MSFEEVPNSGPYILVGREKMDIPWVTNALLDTYFGAWRTHEIIAETIRNSVCLGLFLRGPDSFPISREGLKRDPQIGFCRVVTDGAVFSWLADVVVGASYRGNGYGKFLVREAIKRAPGAIYLSTKDRHEFYAGLGFGRMGDSNIMRKLPCTS